MDTLLRAAFPFFVPALMSLAGCSAPQSMDPAEVDKLRTRLTLADEPDDAQTVLDVRMALVGGERPDVHAMLAHDHEHDHEAGEHAHEHADEEGEESAAVDNPNEVAAAAEEDSHEHAEGEDADDHDHEHAGHDHEHDGDHEHGDHEHADHDHDGKEIDVVMVGIVGGVPNPSAQTFTEFPFAEDRAMFFLADPEAVAVLEEEGHHHAPGEECSFCAANAADASTLIAAVQVTDDDGRVLPVDARELFDLKENDAIVVRGKAKVAAGGILTVNATGVYVRR